MSMMMRLVTAFVHYRFAHNRTFSNTIVLLELFLASWNGTRMETVSQQLHKAAYLERDLLIDFGDPSLPLSLILDSGSPLTLILIYLSWSSHLHAYPASCYLTDELTNQK